jgi:hypothetical protein
MAKAAEKSTTEKQGIREMAPIKKIRAPDCSEGPDLIRRGVHPAAAIVDYIVTSIAAVKLADCCGAGSTAWPVGALACSTWGIGPTEFEWHHGAALPLGLNGYLAGLAIEVGAKFGLNHLEAIWDDLHCWRVGVVILRQTSHACLAAFRTPQVFVPLVGRRHAGDNKRVSSVCRFGPGRKLRKNSNHATAPSEQPFIRLCLTRRNVLAHLFPGITKHTEEKTNEKDRFRFSRSGRHRFCSTGRDRRGRRNVSSPPSPSPLIQMAP